MTDVRPSVSVIVATHERGARLEPILIELLANVAPAEVVVVDDGSTDHTAEVLDRMTKEHAQLKGMVQTNAGGWLALLAGAGAATGDVVLLLDDDVIPDRGTAQAHAARHAGDDRLVVVGYMPVSPAPRTPRTWARDLYAQTYERHCEAWEAAPGTVLESLWGGHLSLRRDNLLALGTRIGDAPRGYHRDLDFGLCAAEAGLRGIFDRRLGGCHLFERSPDDFEANALSSGESLADIHVRHPPASGESPADPLAATFAALAGRPRGHAALRSGLRLAIAAFGALELFRLQRFAAGQLWRVLQARGFARRSRELRGAGIQIATPAPASR